MTEHSCSSIGDLFSTVNEILKATPYNEDICPECKEPFGKSKVWKASDGVLTHKRCHRIYCEANDLRSIA